MKKLLKSEVFGTREQCMDALFKGEKSNVAAWKKKKEKKKILKHRCAKRQIQTGT